MPLPRAVVFDKDGTLIDVHDTWGPVFATILPEIAEERTAEVAGALGVVLPEATLRPDSVVIAGSNADIVAVMAPLLDRSEAELLPVLEARIDELAVRHATPLPATTAVLEKLADDGIWTGLATNDGIAATERQLEALGWRSYFASVLGYDSGFGAKPGPGMLLESARRAGVAVEHLVFVGDSETDRRTAVAAGCDVVEVGPDRTLDSIFPFL